MVTRFHPDGDETPFPRLAVLRESGGCKGALQQPRLDQRVGGGTGTIVSTIFDTAVASAPDIRAVLQVIRSIDKVLDLTRQAGRARSIPAIETNERSRRRSRPGHRHSPCNHQLLLLLRVIGCGLLLRMISGPGLLLLHLRMVGSRLLLLSVGCLLGSVVTGGVAILGRNQTWENESRKREGKRGKGGGDCFHSNSLLLIW